MFTSTANFGRARTIFNTELARRLNAVRALKSVIWDIVHNGGQIAPPPPDDAAILRKETDEMSRLLSEQAPGIPSAIKTHVLEPVEAFLDASQLSLDVDRPLEENDKPPAELYLGHTRRPSSVENNGTRPRRRSASRRGSSQSPSGSSKGRRPTESVDRGVIEEGKKQMSQLYRQLHTIAADLGLPLPENEDGVEGAESAVPHLEPIHTADIDPLLSVTTETHMPQEPKKPARGTERVIFLILLDDF